MRPAGLRRAAVGLLLVVLAACGTEGSDATATLPAASATEDIEDDNTEGSDTIDLFEGGRVVTEDGEEVTVPHFASAGGVFEGQIDEFLPRTVQDEAYEWYAQFYEHQAVGPGSVDEVVLGTTSEVSSVAELYVSLDEEGAEARLEPAS